MYYTSVALIALIVTVIINHVALKKVEKTRENETRYKYRQYLLTLIAFYATDAFWGVFYEQKWVILTYIDTCAFFLFMVASVLFWTRAVVSFTGNKTKNGTVLIGCGWFIVTFEILILIANVFWPIVFSFSPEKEYQALPARYISLMMQMVLFLASAIYAFAYAYKSEGESKGHYRTVGFSSGMMAIFIVFQMLFPLMPLYSLGCLFGTCLIHTFVYKDRDVEYRIKMEAANRKAYKDGLTGVKNKLAYLESLADIEISLENGSLKEYGVVVFDLNGLKTVNDTMGHEAGDEYIKSASRLITQVYRHSPVFRIGGDEFVTILKDDDYKRREELEKTFLKAVEENRKKGLVVVSSGMA
ncbi:MAG: GGDEF domain-containing protein, partial [Lachnospiraceae bacterium]|nr:GGDEF domain-containing protein [Lachnospiraceae bacterium]